MSVTATVTLDPVQKFLKYAQANPHVWELFSKFAWEVIRTGRKNFGAKAIWERMRWYAAFETEDTETIWKLSNNHHAYYARLFMNTFPGYRGFFRTRPVRQELPANVIVLGGKIKI
jgi:hypothetical protein